MPKNNSDYRYDSEEEDLEQKVRKGVKKWALPVAIGVAAIAAFSLSYRPIASQNKGVVTKLGMYDRTLSSGPNFIIPIIESVKQVDVMTTYSVELGYRTLDEGKSGKSAVYLDAEDDLGMRAEAQMLTAEENIAWVTMVLQYQVDPLKVTDFLYNVEDPKETMQKVSEAALRQVVGDYGVDEVLTFGKEEIAQKVRAEAQEMLDEYKMGVIVTGVYLQNPRAPDEKGTSGMTVSTAFQNVETQRQNKEAAINNAQAYYNKVTTEASGAASEILSQARADRSTRIGEAQQDMAEFNQLYRQYLLDPMGVMYRLYVETLEDIYPSLDKNIVDNSLIDSGVIPLIDLNNGNNGGN